MTGDARRALRGIVLADQSGELIRCTRIFVPSFASQRPTGEADPVSLLAAISAFDRLGDPRDQKNRRIPGEAAE